MSIAALAVVLLVPAALLGALAILALVLARRPAPARSAAAEAARRHGLLVTVAAWVLPLTVGPLLLLPIGVLALRLGSVDGATWNAVLVGLYPAMLGLGFLGVHAVGERTWPRPAGPVRRAALVHRGAADVAPRRLRILTWAWGGLLLLALVVGGLTAAPDGRSVRVVDGSGTHGASPYPGWDFSVPLAAAAVLVLLATAGVLRLVAARPAIVDADPAYDAASRRLSAHRVLRGAQLVLGWSLAGVLVVAGNALQAVTLTGLGAVATVLGLLVGLGALAVAVVPARAPAGDAAAVRWPARVAAPEGDREAPW